MAMGTTECNPEQATSMMREAKELWEGIGRPLDAAIADLLLGHVLTDCGSGDGREILEQAAADFERLGVPHLAEYAKSVVT
jgi:hypothetical protein